MNNKLLSLIGFLTLVACSTETRKSSENATPSQASAQEKGPSLIDPANPPKVYVRGIGEGDLVLGKVPEIEIEVTGYPLEKGWQTATVLLNRAVIERVVEPKKTLRISSASLVEGLNQIVVYLERSWGESIKGSTASTSVTFFYSKKDAAIARNIGPSILLILPRGNYKDSAAKKIMFDFLILNGSSRKYRVYYSLAGELREVTVENAPYYFYNLPVGSHTLKVELVDSRGKPLGTPFAATEAEFKIE
jgi:hypothetical protein